MSQTLQWLRAEFLELRPVYLAIMGALVLGFLLWVRWLWRRRTGKAGRTGQVKGKGGADRLSSPEDFEEHFRGARQRIQAAIQAEKDSPKGGRRG